MKYFLLTILLFLSTLHAQTETPRDTIPQNAGNEIDDVVYASATDSLIFNISSKKMFLYGKADLRYKDIELQSALINLDYNTNDLEAFGIKDTSDTTIQSWKDTPILKEGLEVYEGSSLKYNFKTQRGFISMAKNRESDSRYEGEKVKKVEKNIYFIEHGMFTTCELDTPHTYFTASQMKVIQKERIIARWIFMNIAGVPFPLPLPFGIFPSEAGRKSGLIVPTYGQDVRRGQYFNNFGYFWAMSDYMDLSLTGDYYTKGGYGLHSRFRYSKRYSFDGSFNADYSKISIGESTDPLSKRSEVDDWRLSWTHSQNINPTTQLNANLQFSSSSYLQNNSINYNDILSQNLISNATFTKRWDESGASLSINYNRTQKLQSGDIYESLPSITFSKNLFYPFKGESSDPRTQKWYEQVGVSYNASLLNKRSKVNDKTDKRAGVQHRLQINASPKIGYFNISPSINYNEKWYNKRIKIENVKIKKYDPATNTEYEIDTLITKDINEYNFVRTFDMSLTASTKLYGIIQPNILGIEAFRHTLRPSISYTYQPDFSDDTWGYYDYYTDSNGNIIKYDKFSNEVYGGSGSGKRQSINLSIGNVFEMKMQKDPSDTSESTDNKIQLLNIDASVGYNFASEEYKLSDLRLSYRTQIGQYLSFNGSSAYTFYDYEGNTKVNRFLLSAGKGLFRLTNFSFSITTNLSSDKFYDKKNEGTDSDSLSEAQLKKSVYTIPWELSLGYNYNLSKTTPSVVNKYSNLSVNLSFSLTEKWRFIVRGSYDFDRKQFTAPQISIYRDLHCWEFNLIWNPLGTYRGFRFELRMKAPEFRDIKVTRAHGVFSGRGY
ncbi:putative LPS assembly protein LptD [Melioribacter sp. OK-6-Me]|uniref:putative LPS assembly protein LptD n=1 Tax=unclassified Melioribacter TaxID=2627329 RepID=UPI003ED9CB53